MTVTINGSTGIDKVAAGAIEKADLPAGSVLQVVSATLASAQTTTSTSFVTTNLTATITPTSTSNKILVILTAPYYNPAGSAGAGMEITVFRGTTSGTNLGQATYGFGALNSLAGAIYNVFGGNYLDSPSTSSSQLYTVAFRTENAANTAAFSVLNAPATITLMEIAA